MLKYQNSPKEELKKEGSNLIYLIDASKWYCSEGLEREHVDGSCNTPFSTALMMGSQLLVKNYIYIFFKLPPIAESFEL